MLLSQLLNAFYEVRKYFLFYPFMKFRIQKDEKHWRVNTFRADIAVTKILFKTWSYGTKSGYKNWWENTHEFKSIFTLTYTDILSRMLGGIFDQSFGNETRPTFAETLFDYSVKHVNKNKNRKLRKMKAGKRHMANSLYVC